MNKPYIDIAFFNGEDVDTFHGIVCVVLQGKKYLFSSLNQPLNKEEKLGLHIFVNEILREKLQTES